MAPFKQPGGTSGCSGTLVENEITQNLTPLQMATSVTCVAKRWVAALA